MGLSGKRVGAWMGGVRYVDMPIEHYRQYKKEGVDVTLKERKKQKKKSIWSW